MPKPDDSEIGHTDPGEEDYFRDGALNDPSGDEFSHLHYAEVLSDILRKSKTPLNIGLYGKWGVGKSSIAHMLRDKIGKDGNLDGFRYAEVDAWGLSPKALPQGLLEALNSQLDSTYKPGDLEDMLYNKRQVQHTRLHGLKTWWWIPLAIIGVSTFAALSEYPELVNSPVLGGFAAALLAGMAKLLFGTSRKTIPRAASSQQFGKIYGKIVERCGGKKLVVVIDNLDRCENAVVVELLGLIQTFMVKDNCVNILACDDEALVSHLKNSKTVRTERDGNEFLSKFFQVTLRISSFLGESLRSYAKRQIDKRSVKFDQFALTILLSGAIDNPRKINQFLNIAVALYRLAELRERSGMIQEGMITRNTNLLLKSVVLRHEWPEFCKAVEADPGMYEDESRLAEWCKKMAGGDKITEAESSRLLVFLDATRIPGAVSIIPFLRMSQAPHMMQPGILAFEDAFSRSSPEAASRFESLDSGAQEAYLDKVGEILKESASESDPNMPALSSNVVMLAGILKAASDDSVRARTATMLGQCLSDRLLEKAREIVGRIGPEPIIQMQEPMRNRICERIVLDAFQADPPDRAVFELFSKNRDMIEARLVDLMGEMAVDKLGASGLWDESFIEACLEYRREDAPMSKLASHIISNATFGVSPSTVGYDRLCVKLAELPSAGESELLRSRICNLVTQCSKSGAPLPQPLLERVNKSEVDEKICEALGGLVRASSDHAQNAEILKIVAKSSGDAKQLEPASSVFAAYLQTVDAQKVIELVGNQQYRRFLTTKTAIDSMLELCGNARYQNLATIKFLLTHTPVGLKEHVGSVFSDAIVSKNAPEYGLLLTAARQRGKKFDADLIAAIMKACLTKASRTTGAVQHAMYVEAARIGHENHAHEIVARAEILIRSANEEDRGAGFQLLDALNEDRAEPLGILQSINAAVDAITIDSDAVADHLEFLRNYGKGLATAEDRAVNLLTACLDRISRFSINAGFKSAKHTKLKDIADMAMECIAVSGDAVQVRMIEPMIDFVRETPSKEAKNRCRQILEKHRARLNTAQKHDLAQIFADV